MAAGQSMAFMRLLCGTQHTAFRKFRFVYNNCLFNPPWHRVMKFNFILANTWQVIWGLLAQKEAC